jgi:hypothetical protein
MRPTRRWLAYAVAAVALSACNFYRVPGVSGPSGRPRPTGPSPADGPGLPSPGAPIPQGTANGTTVETRMTRKRVAAKEEPTTLVADDRTRCRVTAQKYRDTAIGDQVLCDWQTS